MTKKIIVGLDASTTHVGWSVANGEEYIDSGVYVPPGQNVAERVAQIAVFVHDLFYQRDPDVVGIEVPAAHHGNFKTDRALARVFGAVEAVVAVNFEGQIRLIEVYPASVKTTGFHKGAIYQAEILTGHRPMQGDEADAIGVWQAVLVALREEAFIEQSEWENIRNRLQDAGEEEG